ncbi:MAG: DUF1109 domain-containing protein [Alphaproteobacteria bacterium]|nr:DUF1109 domain-containing protein [Alphaproteobacteria bacterium]
MHDVGKEDSTQKIINSLCEDLHELKLAPHPLKMALLWMVLGVVYLGVCLYVFEIRDDLGTKLLDFLFVFEMILTLSMAISAAFCSVWMAVPDMRGQKWMLSVPITFFAVLVTWIGLQTLLASYKFPDIHWHNCYKEAMVFGVIPAIALIYFSLRGKTTRPAGLSVMNALAVGGFGYTALRLSCGSDNIGHICAYHILPYILFALFCIFIVRKIYRW